jgi:hypothetical protein
MGSKLGNKLMSGLIALVLLWLISPSVGGEPIPPGIHVELSTNKPLWLHITLQPGTDSRLTVYASDLPWGNKYSMILIAVLPSGQSLKKELTIDDPSPRQVSLDPKVPVSGDINLADVFGSLKDAIKASDVHLFWAYEAPEDLHIARHSGGWILIPQGVYK